MLLRFLLSMHIASQEGENKVLNKVEVRIELIIFFKQDY